MPKPHPDPTAVADYLDAAPEPARSRLRALAAIIREEAPEAIERLAYGLATWHQGENLIHLGAFTHHVGVYPGPAAIVAFAEELAGFPTSKGAIQVPHDGPLPTELVRRLTRWRLEQVAKKPAKAKASAREGLAAQGDGTAYHAALPDADRVLCEALNSHISAALPDAEGKVWHGHPVWFLAGNPLVGYSPFKGGIRLLFWSGQSFEEPALAPVGKYKAAEARFTRVEDIEVETVRRWLGKARAIQWDYQHLVKRKGVLERRS